ncbi:transposase [Tetragenococcus halophilus]
MVDHLLSYHSVLRQDYKIYQSLLSAFYKQDIERFDQLLKTDGSQLPDPFQPVVKTFRKYRQEIHLALTIPYSNGLLEGLNNHIKVLKRVAYGFHDPNVLTAFTSLLLYKK